LGYILSAESVTNVAHRQSMIMRMLVLTRALLCAVAVEQSVASSTSANPIRKVVNLLQAMQKKVGEEGARAEELHEKFMCYCKNSGGDLSASITAAEAKIIDVDASIKRSTAKKEQLDGDLKSHQADRDAAKKAMAEATALRQKTKATFDKDLADNEANVAALIKATDAIGKGMGGSFLQTPDAGMLRALVASNQDMTMPDRQEMLSFLDSQQRESYVPASGEIVGILKQMTDEMLGDKKRHDHGRKGLCRHLHGSDECKGQRGGSSADQH